MITKRIIILIALSLLAGCGPLQAQGQLARQAKAEWALIKQGLEAIIHSQKLKDDAVKAGRLLEAQQHAAVVATNAERLRTLALRFPPESPGPLPENLASIFKLIPEVSVTAHLDKFKADRSVAVAAGVKRIKSERGLLANWKEDELERLLRDFACLHIQKFVDHEVPSKEDYVIFLRDKSLEQVVPWATLKGQAESVIEFAKAVSQARSSAEIEARRRILIECNFH